jgi:hypothetical protein
MNRQKPQLAVMYKEYVVIRMQTLKTLCDKKDLHRVIEVAQITINELQSLSCLDFNEKKCTCLLKMLIFNVIRYLWSDAIEVIRNIMTEMKMTDLMMTRRLTDSISPVGNLNMLPMDTREYIASLIR